MRNRYYDLNTYFRDRFGERVHKISVDAGMTCPNRDGTLGSGGCIYCNARGSGTGNHAKGHSITRQIENSKTAIIQRFKARKFMAYFQSFTNTYAPLARLEALYDEALAVPDVVGLAIGTRPDCISEGVLDLLQSYADKHLIWVEYGLQSAHDQTLARINRGHDVKAFESAVAATSGRGIHIGTHIILGLPGESGDHMRATADFIASMPIDGVKLHLLYVIKGTPMEALYAAGLYRCLEQDEYVDLVCDVIERLPASFVIQRLTGDPHKHELAAPQWALAKTLTLTMIKKRLEERDTWQSKLTGSHKFSPISDFQPPTAQPNKPNKPNEP
jgi:radical SAM protein (TIGR01212 family)